MTTGHRWLVATPEYAGLTAYTGGIGRHYAALLPALVAHGEQVDLAVFSDAPPRADADLAGVRLVSFRRTERMSRLGVLAARAAQVRDLHRAGAYDRVFVPEWGALGAALPRSAPLLTNLATSTRLTRQISDLRVRDLPWDGRLSAVVQGVLETRQIRRSRGLVSISRAMLERTRAMLGAVPPAEIVRNCIDVDAVRAGAASAALPEAWPATDDPVILFLGRIERRKGVVDAVEAFGDIHAALPRARLVLAGAGGDARFEPTRRALLDLLPPTAGERVTWLGHVDGDALYRAIQAADVVLCPSRWEGFGNAALEAKALATPLIVTSGSGFDDFCVDGRDCLVVPPAAPRELATATLRLLSSPGAAQSLADRAAAEIGRFAPAPVAAALIEAAERLLGGPRP